MRLLLLCLSLLATTPCWGRGLTYAGPLIAFSAKTLESDELLIQPYALQGRLKGFYDRDSRLRKDRNAHYTQLFAAFKHGLLTKRVDLELDVSGTFSTDRGTETVNMGDITFLVGFQFLEEQKNSWTPNFKVIVGQLFPTGNFEELNPTLRGAGITSQGAFVTFPVIALSKTLYLWPDHPCMWSLNLIHGIPLETRVKGANIFTGPNPDASGRVSPGVYSTVDLAVEWKITRKLSWVFETLYTYQTRGSFFPSTPVASNLRVPSSDILSIVPGFGIAFSPETTLLLTGWLSVYGRNNPAFTSGAAYFSFDF